MTDMTDNLMHPKGGIHSTYSHFPFYVPESSHRVWSIPPILVKVGILNLVCGCIFGCKVLCAIFGVTVTLTSGLSHRIIMSRAYLREFRAWLNFGVVDCRVLFWDHCNLDL